MVGSRASGIFLCGQWSTRLHLAGLHPGGVGCTDRSVISGRPVDECHQKIGDGLPTMLMSSSHLEAAYEWMMTGAGPSYRTLQIEWLCCSECATDLAAGLLSSYQQTQHGRGRTSQWDNTPPPEDPRIYRVSLQTVASLIGFTIKVCRGRETIITNPRIQFVHHNVRDMIVIMEKGNRPHPRFSACDMFVPWEALNRLHPTTFLCNMGTDQKWQRLA